jgi:diguanylate cyclase (GGDEF)-like protein/PAS domain S-box-containing protein
MSDTLGIDVRLRRQNQVLVDLARRESIHAGRLDEALRAITEAAAGTLDVERVSVWLYADDRSGIRCADVYERTPECHSSGEDLSETSNPAYFRALESERTLAAHDAVRDQRTSAFANDYLIPLGITSTLDAPVRRLGKICGVVCNEHVGPQRCWTAEEENFASSIADLVVIALDAAERRHRADFEQLISSISTQFINLAPDELDAAIDEALGGIGRFVDADRSYVVLFSTDLSRASITHEWFIPGLSSRKPYFTDRPVAAMPTTIAELRALHNVHVPRVSAMAAEAAGEQMFLRQAGIESFVAVPMVYKHALVGSIGFGTVGREKRWSEETVSLVRIAGEIFVGALERARADRSLRESEQRYRLMAENSTDMISRTTAYGQMLYVSDATRTILGYEPSEMAGLRVFDFIVEGDHEVVKRAARAAKATGPATCCYRARRKDGSWIWFETTSRAILDPDGEVREFISVSRDISERKRAEEQIEYQAYHDALTGLPNRLLFRDRLTVALAHARRLDVPLAVMFLDLDHFKNVNDTLGHSLGDELLKAIAARLRAVLREEDTIARMGGDEFTVLLSDLRNADDAAVIAQKILEAVAYPVQVEGEELYITTSIGIALYPNDGDSAEALLKSADHAMYRAKDAGRSSYKLCTASMNDRAMERLSLENALRFAVDRGELELHFQPQIRIATGAIAGMEALIRWNHPTRGLIGPSTFIPIAEESRLIGPIGEWVLREACRQAKAWQQTHYPDLRMAVNLSARQFQNPDLPKTVAAVLEETGLDARCLELEITESTAMQNTQRTIAMLETLREMGVRIAIDDFGTGHSSLNYLRSFPIDTVKIDQAFVHEIESSRSDRAIVAAVIAMAHGLALRVTAEGVETEEQLRFLQDEGCEEAQGFLFGRPMAAG